jgi:hypothetical protein
MKRTFFLVVLATISLLLSATAGTINGKVSGVSGESVVYVDVIQGKTFPAPTNHPVVDQKGLMFTPHGCSSCHEITGTTMTRLLPCAICSGVAGSRCTFARKSESLFASRKPSMVANCWSLNR